MNTLAYSNYKQHKNLQMVVDLNMLKAIKAERKAGNSILSFLLPEDREKEEKEKLEALKILKGIEEEKIAFDIEFSKEENNYASNIDEIEYCQRLLENSSLIKNNNKSKAAFDNIFNELIKYEGRGNQDDFFHPKMTRDDIAKAYEIYGESFISERIGYLKNQNLVIQENLRSISKDYDEKLNLVKKLWDCSYKTLMKSSIDEMLKEFTVFKEVKIS